MSRSEFVACSFWTLGICALVFPVALFLVSGHFGGGGSAILFVAGVVIATLFLLPSIAAWFLVEPWAGSIAGGVAVAAATLGWVFALVHVVRRKWRKRRQRVGVTR